MVSNNNFYALQDQQTRTAGNGNATYSGMLYNSAPASPQWWGQQNANPLPPVDVNESPMSVAEVDRSSWKQMLTRNIGRNVIASFLIGTGNTVVAEGVLSEVGHDYVVIYQADRGNYISGDFYAIKFVEFTDPPMPQNTVYPQGGAMQQHYGMGMPGIG